MSETPAARITRAELETEAGTALPAKEVISLLDLNIDADLALALAAPIDLAVAANAQAALPIDASVSANILSFFSDATAVANQGATITQVMNGVDASADAMQDASVDQSSDGDVGDDGDSEDLDTMATMAAIEDDLLDDGVDTDLDDPADDLQGAVDDLRGAIDDLEGVTTELDGITQQLGDTVGQLGDTVGDVTSELGGALDNALADGLLSVDVNVALDADLAAPIAGAVAANAQVAAPIDAAVAANIGSIDSEAIAIADQTAAITQVMEDVTASATAEQDADVTQ